MTRHSVNNNTHMGFVISLCSNLISLIPSQAASNFRHLLSCGTIGFHIFIENLSFSTSKICCVHPQFSTEFELKGTIFENKYVL